MGDTEESLPEVPVRAAGIAGIFRGLKSKNYRLYFSCMFVSLLGTWISTTAMSWLVYRLTDSEKLLGLVSFGAHFPAVVVAPLAAVFIDRADSRRVLVYAHAAYFFLSLTLFALVFSGQIAPWMLVLFALCQGVVAGVDMPARQGLLPRLVEDRADLPNVIALNTAMFHSARMIGPAIGGMIIYLGGEAPCFFIDALSFLAPIAGLLAMGLAPHVPKEKTKQFRADFIHGFRYTFSHPVIRPLLAAVAVVSLVGPTPTVLLPAFVKEVFHGGPDVLGFLGSASGAGSLLAALYLATRSGIKGLERLVLAGAIALSLVLCLLSQTAILWQAYLLLFAIGSLVAFCGASSATVIQTVVDDSLRARAMSFYFIVFLGTMPIGNLLAGIAGEAFGLQRTFLGAGLAALAIACLLAWRARRGVRQRT